MKICYIDESGCTGIIPSASSDIQPVLCIVGVFIDYRHLHYITEDYLKIKSKWFPGIASAGNRYLDTVLAEVKGGDVRKKIGSGARGEKRHAIGYLDSVIRLCKQADVKIVGRVWVKGIGDHIDGTAIYTYSIQSIYQYFHDYLARNNDVGFVVADSRMKRLNTQVSHSIFTQKFKSSGDLYDRIIELPAFSHSDNHTGLQLSDTICSSILFPMAVETYCKGIIQNVHVRPGFSDIKSRYKEDIKEMQHRYKEANERWRGGIVVSDGLRQFSGGKLFST